MASITLNSNVASLDAQRRLGESTASLSRGFERLSSGLRINRASDDAAGLSVASALDADARVFGQGVRNVNDGISYLNVAEGATASLRDILLRLRELSTQSSNGTLGDAQRRALDKEAQALVGEYNRIVETTSYNGAEVFASASQDLVLQAGYGKNGTLSVSLKGVTTVTKGDGTFGGQQSFATGTNPNAVAIGDFNGDGKADLVTADNGGTASVLLGNGDGTFQAKQSFAAGARPYAVAVGDLNGDGNADLVTADVNSSTASVLLGNGDGTFQARQFFATGTNPTSVAIGDVNGDGKADLATADNGGTASVLLGNGDGTFQAKQAFAAGNLPEAVSIGDFNVDGKADLVTVDYFGGAANVLLGNGDGTFQPKQSFAAGSYLGSVAIADFNGDGNPDLAATSGTSSTAVVLLGHGDGTFQASQPFSSTGANSVAIGDFNGDGKADLVTAEGGSNTASVFLGNGDGTFAPKQSFSTIGPNGVAIGDFNGDGLQDIVTSDGGGSSVNVLLGNGTSTTTTVDIGTISGISVATQQGAASAQGAIDSLLQTVNTVAGLIGSGMSRFRFATDMLNITTENDEAARSRITDADVAEESANLVKSRILQQAGAAVLSEANQAPALALVLLKGA